MTNLLRLVCLDASVLTAQTQILAGNSVPIKPDIRPSERNAITYPLYPVDVGSAKPTCTYWCPCSGSTKWVLPNRIRNHRFNQHGGLRTRGWQKLQKRSKFSIPEPFKKKEKPKALEIPGVGGIFATDCIQSNNCTAGNSRVNFDSTTSVLCAGNAIDAKSEKFIMRPFAIVG